MQDIRKWLVDIWHQVITSTIFFFFITSTSIDLSSKVFCLIHLISISQVVLMNLIHNMFENYNFKITTTSPRAQWVNVAQHHNRARMYLLSREWVCRYHPHGNGPWHPWIRSPRHVCQTQPPLQSRRISGGKPHQADCNTRCNNMMLVIILCMHPANKRWCYIVTSSLIGWALTQNDPCKLIVV